jgi:hypothetical protein
LAPGFAGVGPFAGGDWRGFAAIGAGWLAPVDWGGVGAGAIGRGGAIDPPIMPNRGKTGGFCSTYAKQTAPKTDTRAMRTRVNPVILYKRTVILGPEKSKSHLRISEKKIGKKSQG